jgi:hypothetical protein
MPTQAERPRPDLAVALGVDTGHFGDVLAGGEVPVALTH